MAEEARATPEVAVEKKTDVVVVELEAASVTVSTEKKEDEKSTPPPVAEEEKKISQSASFKEESNKVDDLADLQKKALDELKELVRKALDKHEFTSQPPPPPVPEEVKTEEKKEEEKDVKKEDKKEEEPKVEDKKEAIQAEKVVVEEKVAEIPIVAEEKHAVPEVDKPTIVVAVDTVDTVAVTTATTAEDDGVKTVEAIEESVVSVVSTPPPPPTESEAPPPAAPEEVFIWGIPLLGDDRSDVLLLKFLRARDFKVKDALSMLKDTVKWRKEFGIDELLEEGLGNDFEKVVFIHGVDKENHPVCYNVYGEFQDKELYKIAFSTEKGKKFLKWRILFLEKGIRQFEFSPDGVCSFVQVNDLKNFPVFGKKGIWHVTNQAVHVLQDNYPEFVAKQVFINVPWWYLAFNRMISPFLTQRTKSKCVYSGPASSAETLFKYIAPEHVPVQYGGLSQEKDDNFSTADPVTEITIKLNSKEIVEIPVSEPSVLLWELRVLGWDVTYGAEFVPDAENGYTVIIQKPRKMVPSDEAIVKNSYKIGEPGKVVFTIDNHASKKKKKLLYRTKIKSSSD